MNETVSPIHRKAKSRTRSGRRMPTRSTSRLTLPIARAYGPATTATMCEHPGARSIGRRLRESVAMRAALDAWKQHPQSGEAKGRASELGDHEHRYRS